MYNDTFFSSELIKHVKNKLDEQKNKPGLYVVATPIGNILDITFRAIEILKKSKYIFAEDTRNSRKLLNFFGIKSKLIACHEHNEIDINITSLLNKSEIYSLISDAGTPTISDPGYRIVNWCLENDINICPIPGPSSFVAGLSVSGIATDKFMFLGFLPSKKSAKKNFLNSIKNYKITMIFFESHRRLLETLECLNEIFGDRYCCICKEMTKIFEEFTRGSFVEVFHHFSFNAPKGEFVIVVSGNSENSVIDHKKIQNELISILEKLSLKDSVQYISNKYGINKKEIYKKALELKKS